MKPASTKRWREATNRVRVDTLKQGARFECISGEAWTYERRDGASSGVHHVTGDTGKKTAFAGCAEVIPLS